MRFLASAGALAIVAASWGTAAAALTLAQAASPAETPPSGYSKDVYVDSRGCVYVRASIGSTVNWVPRLSRDRKTVVCGRTPTGGIASVAASPPAPPAPPPAAVTAPTKAATAATAATVAARPPAAPPAPAPASYTVPMGAAVAAPVAAGPAPVTRTMEVSCPPDGSSLHVNIGGDTVRVNCPPGVARATSYIVTHADGSRSRLVATPATATGQARLGDPNAGPGHGYDAAASAPTTGPVPHAIYTVAQAVPARPVRIPAGYRPAWDDDRLNPFRGPRTAYGNAQMATVLDTATVPMRPAEPAPAGTVIVTGSEPFLAAPATPTVGSGTRYVQVGAFRRAGNTENALARIRGLGMSGSTARTGSGLTLVMAGPFASTAELQRALAILRGHYPDAFVRG